MLPFIVQRQPGYSLLSGYGIEIGAFEHPAELPKSCRVEYCDAITPEQAQILFPEIDSSKLVKVDHIVDLNKEGLSKFAPETFDFVVFNHVIEHLANPVFIIQEVLRVLKRGGCMVIAAPDKNYTFDKLRPLTSWEHLKDDFEKKVTDSTPDDYHDMIQYIHTNLINEPRDVQLIHLNGFKSRREHLHIWTSETFREFLGQALSFLDLEALPLFETTGAQNHFEYFGVWVKGGEKERAKFTKPTQGIKIFPVLWDKIAARYKSGGISGVFSAVKRKITQSDRAV